MKTRKATWRTLVLFTCLSSFANSSDPEDRVVTRVFSEGIKNLVINGDSGEIDLAVSDAAGPTRVEATKVDFDAHSTLSMDVDGDTLKLSSRRGGFFGGSGCKVDYKISTSAGTNVTMKYGDSLVRMAGQFGNLKLDAGSSELLLDGEARDLKVKAGSAKVDAGFIMGDSIFKLGSGDVRLRVVPSGVTRSILAEMGSGKVEVLAPAASKFVTDFSGSSPAVHNSSDFSGIAFTSPPDFTFKSILGRGDVSVKKF